MFENHPLQLINILNAASRKCKSGQHEKEKQENRRLYNWIYEVTSQLDKYNCKTAQRIHWILNSLEDFPRCIVCGKPICDPRQFKTIQKGYNDFCSVKCAKEHGVDVSKEVRFKKNNGKYFSDESIAKSKQSFIEHYGVDNNMKSEEGRKVHGDAIEKKYGKGIRNVFQAESIKRKSEQTRLEKYGDPYWSNHEKAAQTYKNRSQEEKDKRRKSFREKSLEHYGVDHPMKDPVVCMKSNKNRKLNRYMIDGYYFDSKPEFCFYVCCRDFGIEIECHPINKTMTYFDYEGRQHQYFPDFYIPSIDRIVEIKGNQFFKDHDETTELIDLYGVDSSRNTAKYYCMLENNVLIISTSRYILYEKHVKRKYGNKWIKQHKVTIKK